ncbi:MAG TPA: ABC transporter permease [Pyrinomonadaceae bacterium]|nr:ABC transporter permease [Pyrinomonadaceae bacterium]
MKSLWQDARYGARMLWKSPAFTLVAVAAIALGVGATTAVFSVVNGVLLRPLPYPEPDRLELVFLHSEKTGRYGVSAADFLAIEEKYASVGSAAAARSRGMTLTGGGAPEQIQTTAATSGFFKTLGVAPARGRDFLPGEDRPGAEPVVVVSHGFWQRRMGGDADVLGRRVTLDGVGHTIVGVMPADFVSPEGVAPEVWPALQIEAPKRRGPFTLRVLVRRNEGVSEEQGREALARIAREVYEQWAASYPDANVTYGTLSLKGALVGNTGETLVVLLVAVACVLLIASVNVANLLLARAGARRQEMAVRAALGASRMRLVRQLVTESLVLALVGGAGGVLLAVWGVDLLLALGPDSIPRLDSVRVDGGVLAFAGLAALASCLVFGLAPALYATGRELGGPLKSGGRGGDTAPGRGRLRDLLVVSEFALALPLLVGAGLMVNSLMRLERVAPGFERERLLVARVNLPAQKYAEPERAAQFFTEVTGRLQSLPGVGAASVSSNIPLDRVFDSNNFDLESRPTPPGETQPSAEYMSVGPDYFRTLGVPLLKGRYLTEQDDGEAPRVMVVSQAAAERFFAGQDPVGQRLKTGGCTECEWTTVVGVVGDVKDHGLGAGDVAAMYVPARQEPGRSMHLLVRTHAEPSTLVAAVRAEVNAVDADLALTQVGTMDELLASSLGQPRYRAALLGAFAGVALLLAAVGIYGVLAYAVSQRTREIGIRLALGAQRGDILRMVVGRGMALTLLGVAVGLAASLLLTRYLASLLYGVSSTDPATFAAVVAVLAAVALLACLIPARRATKVDPMVALRYE